MIQELITRGAIKSKDQYLDMDTIEVDNAVKTAFTPKTKEEYEQNKERWREIFNIEYEFGEVI